MQLTLTEDDQLAAFDLYTGLPAGERAARHAAADRKRASLIAQGRWNPLVVGAVVPEADELVPVAGMLPLTGGDGFLF